MKIATVLFVYNRQEHTKSVLDALEKNTVLPEKLFIFHDGIKNEKMRTEWEEVKEIIHNVQFCPTEIIEFEHNKGLACSIVEGMDYVLAEYDAAIVLEDDCVPCISFMKYMYQSLKKYVINKQVYCVSGYAWNIMLQDDKFDAYFNGRISSWGWGTWKDRWEEYSQDNGILNRITNDNELSKNLALWGRDLPGMFEDRITGRNNSWAVYWALKVIEKKGLCVCPYKSLIVNVGFDGSGVHCQQENMQNADICLSDIENFKLPDKLEISERVSCAFSEIYGSKLKSFDINSKKQKVVVYGLGSFFHLYENELGEDYSVVALCDENKNGYYAGFEIIKPKRLVEFKECKVIIMLNDKKMALEIRQQINEEYRIPLNNIVCGIDIYNHVGA